MCRGWGIDDKHGLQPRANIPEDMVHSMRQSSKPEKSGSTWIFSGQSTGNTPCWDFRSTYRSAFMEDLRYLWSNLILQIVHSSVQLSREFQNMLAHCWISWQLWDMQNKSWGRMRSTAVLDQRTFHNYQINHCPNMNMSLTMLDSKAALLASIALLHSSFAPFQYSSSSIQ